MILISFAAHAQEDSLHFSLEGSAIVSSRSEAPVSGGLDLGHPVTFTPASIDVLPRIMGDLDPFAIVQTMPGIHSNSSFDAGLYIHGFDSSHNRYTLAGAPVYITPRMLGFFPVLNENHFSKFRLELSADGSYLGGSLESEISDTLFTMTHSDASLGLMSARATVMTPVGHNSSLTVSLRQSFLNQLYKGVLRYDSGEINYCFTDANATWLWKPDSDNTFDANLYISYDKSLLNAENYHLMMGGNWEQGVSSMRWRHDGNICSETVLYASGNFKQLYLDISESNVNTPSNLLETGIKSEISFPCGFQADAGVIYRHTNPIFLSFDELNEMEDTRQNSLQAEICASKDFRLDLLTITPGLRFSTYREFVSAKTFFNADPEIKFQINMLKAGHMTISAGRKHQFITELGLSCSGFPFRFWIASGKYVDPQESFETNLSHSINLSGGDWTVSSQFYWARLHNQIEFRGFLTDMLSTDYSLDNSIVKTNGFNCGACIMLSKNSGPVTGWLSYSYSRAMRRSEQEGLPELFPSSHDRPHDFNATLTWHIGRFDIGGNVILASGDPFTSVKYYYMVGNSIMAEYNDFNSSRLSPFFRMDISANYNLKSHGRYTHGINLSVINVTARKNETLYFLYISRSNTFSYRPGVLSIPVLPSISYYCKF